MSPRRVGSPAPEPRHARELQRRPPAPRTRAQGRAPPTTVQRRMRTETASLPAERGAQAKQLTERAFWERPLASPPFSKRRWALRGNAQSCAERNPFEKGPTPTT